MANRHNRATPRPPVSAGPGCFLRPQEAICVACLKVSGVVSLTAVGEAGLGLGVVTAALWLVRKPNAGSGETSDAAA